MPYASNYSANAADWVTAASYVAAAFLSGRAAYHARNRAAREATFWTACVALLVFLGINELLDLQKYLTLAARAHAHTHGWYDHRREVQLAFIVSLALASLLLTAASFALIKGLHKSIQAACFGFVFIGAFIILRAASFHHVSLWFSQGPSKTDLISMPEFAGIVIVAAAAWLYRRTCS